MFSFISAHAVNILYWDQWDIYPLLFGESSWWELVRFRPGVHRQGPGYLVTRLVADLTSMNTRADAFTIGGAFVLMLIAAIWLKWRLVGRFHLTDAMLPLIVLSTIQQDTWVGTPNLSVAAMPVLFLFLVCVSWLIPGQGTRVAAVVICNIVMVNSGYGMAGAPLAPALFAATLLENLRRKDRRQAIWSGLGLIGSLGAIAIYLYELNPDFGASCPPGFSAEKLLLPGFVVLMLAKFVGLDFDYFVFVASVVGTLLLFVMVEALVRRGRQLMSPGGGDTRVAAAVFMLIGFSILYAFLTAYGRNCQAMMVAQLSRYMTFLVPGFVGLYIDILTREGLRWRRPALGILIAGVVLGAFSVEWITDDGARRLRDTKVRWKECYLRTEDISRCNQETRGTVYPGPNELFSLKLEYLKAKRLNLYSER